MDIRRAETRDLEDIMVIYARAQEFMRCTGNPQQWGNRYPKRELVEMDIAQQRNYVLEDEQGVCGVFVFVVGEDDTYKVIEDGAWLNENPYGTIHRIATSGRVPGIMKLAVQFCLGIIDNIRIDTHEDNAVMRHLIEKNGFSYCGRIYTYDGSPRLAYQLELGGGC